MSDPVGRPTRVAILVTGDEVLAGRVQDRNGPWLTRDLAARGVRVERTVTVGDGLADLVDALEGLARLGVDLVCVTGGLGPTADDRTMEAVARFCRVPLQLDSAALEMVEERSRGIRGGLASDDQLAAMRRKQATMPQGATVLPPVGTAPGCIARRGGLSVVVLPGPPHELTAMWQTGMGQGGPIADLVAVADVPTRTLRLWWVFEADLMAAFAALPGEVVDRVGTYTREGELEVLAPVADAELVEGVLRSAFADALFSTDGRQVEELVAGLLVDGGLRMAVAESCTGGMLGARLTDLPGASRWFAGGVISYADDVKAALLGVDPALIARVGAVSEEVAVAMATGVRTATGADWAVSITGVAGPDGGTPDKPVGTVWIGVAGPQGADATLIRVRYGDRGAIRRRAVGAALHLLRLALVAARTSPRI